MSLPEPGVYRRSDLNPGECAAVQRLHVSKLVMPLDLFLSSNRIPKHGKSSKHVAYFPSRAESERDREREREHSNGISRCDRQPPPSPPIGHHPGRRRRRRDKTGCPSLSFLPRLYRLWSTTLGHMHLRAFFHALDTRCSPRRANNAACFLVRIARIRSRGKIRETDFAGPDDISPDRPRSRPIAPRESGDAGKKTDQRRERREDDDNVGLWTAISD